MSSGKNSYEAETVHIDYRRPKRWHECVYLTNMAMRLGLWWRL